MAAAAATSPKSDFVRPWVPCLSENKVQWKDRAVKDAEERKRNNPEAQQESEGQSKTDTQSDTVTDKNDTASSSNESDKKSSDSEKSSEKGAMGGDDDKKEDGADSDEGEDPEVAEARREAEERRIDKHRKMEDERENVRQSIRDKYGLKKKVPEEEMILPPDDPGRIGRKKKTPAELAAEANAEDEDDDEFAKLPANLSEFTSKVSELPGKLAQSVGGVTEKCSLQ